MREIVNLKAWVIHWGADAQRGLPVTLDSLCDAGAALDRVAFRLAELESLYEQAREDTKRATGHLSNKIEKMREALDDCEAYFDNRSDVSDGDYGIPEPNEEMRMLALVQSALASQAEELWNKRPSGSGDGADSKH